MPSSIFRVDPIRDLPLAKEFRDKPVGHHSANLQRVLNALRGEPLQGKYVLVCTKPHREWQLARLTGERGKPVALVKGKTYRSLMDAEWDIFKLRWEALTGAALVLPES
jgi:hypothetical protein